MEAPHCCAGGAAGVGAGRAPASRSASLCSLPSDASPALSFRLQLLAESLADAEACSCFPPATALSSASPGEPPSPAAAAGSRRLLRLEPGHLAGKELGQGAAQEDLGNLAHHAGDDEQALLRGRGAQVADDCGEGRGAGDEAIRGDHRRVEPTVETLRSCSFPPCPAAPVTATGALFWLLMTPVAMRSSRGMRNTQVGTAKLKAR